MTDVLWPPDLCPVSQTWSGIGNTAVFTGPFSGVSRTYSRPGSLMRCVITLPMMKGRDRARWAALLAALRDRGNRIWMPDFSMLLESGLPIGGSFPATELLTNNDFSDGTTGWTAHTPFNHTVSDRIARMTRNRSSNTTDVISVASAINGLSQYATYVARSLDIAGLGSFTSGVQLGSTQGAEDYGRTTASGGGLKVLGAVIPATSAYFGLVDYQSTPNLAGDFYSCSYTSLALGALVDGGGNYLLYSDQIDNAAWTKTRCSVTANNHTAPDGTTTADKITEDTSTNNHYFIQSYTRASAAEDWVAYGHFFRSAGTRNVLIQIASESGVTNYAYAYFNLGTGAVTSSGVSGSATNVRAYIVAVASSTYLCVVVGRLPATTAAVAKFAIADSTPSETYTGDGSSAIGAWRCGAMRSSAPVLPTQTTSTVVPAASQTGNGIYVKGLPASTAGLLEVGDFVQIGSQLNRVTSRLNSDAAGRGYLQCGNPWREATNNAPVIVNTPMCKMMLATDSYDIETGPGQFSPLTLELIEAID